MPLQAGCVHIIKMTFNVLGYATQSPKSPLAPFYFKRRDPRENDVVVDILYCGVCHSDLHQAFNDWGISQYPIVPGHEIVGRIRRVGSEVRKFKLGELVGIGCIIDSCRECSPCKNGLEQYCEKGYIQTYNSFDRHDHTLTYGGYSRSIVCPEDFVLRIPKTLDIKAAAPLLCAGITTWSPLRHWNITKGSRVAVVGLGGLGHMAIKLARALGAEVTLFTRSPSKEADAWKLGANYVVISTEASKMEGVKCRFDLIIDTVPYAHDINPYISTLTLDGTLVFVGFIGDIDPILNTMPMVLGRRSVAGSCIGGIAQTQEMLDFCGDHNITADVEIIRMDEINGAFERMLRNEVKYRFVIDMSTLDDQ